MATFHPPQSELVPTVHPDRTPAGGRQSLMEEVCFASLAVLGSMLILTLLLLVLRVLYFTLAMKNGMFVPPLPGLS